MELEGKPTVMVNVSWRWMAVTLAIGMLALLGILGQVLASDRTEFKSTQKEQGAAILELQRALANAPTRDDLKDFRADMRLLTEKIDRVFERRIQ